VTLCGEMRLAGKFNGVAGTSGTVFFLDRSPNVARTGQQPGLKEPNVRCVPHIFMEIFHGR
jgi:hypothetical protein